MGLAEEFERMKLMINRIVQDVDFLKHHLTYEAREKVLVDTPIKTYSLGREAYTVLEILHNGQQLIEQLDYVYEKDTNTIHFLRENQKGDVLQIVFRSFYLQPAKYLEQLAFVIGEISRLFQKVTVIEREIEHIKRKLFI